MPQWGHAHFMAGWAKRSFALLITMDVRLCQICFRATDRGYIALVDTTVSSSGIFALLLGVDMRLYLVYFRFAKLEGAGVPERVGFADRC